MKLKLFLISIIALLALVAYQKYVDTNTLKLINSWSTYVSPKHPFQLNYPSEMSISVDTDGQIIFKNIDTFFTVTIWESTDQVQTVNNVRAQTEGHLLVNPPVITNLMVDGNETWRLDYTSQSNDLFFSDVIIFHNQKAYILEAKTKMIDQILSTFHFLD